MVEPALPSRSRSAVLGALVGASGAASVAFSAPEHDAALPLLLALAVLCAALAITKRPSSPLPLALGLALHAPLLGWCLFAAVSAGLDSKLVESVCGPLFSSDLDHASFFHALFTLPVLAIGGIVAFVLARFLARRAQILAPVLRLASLAALAGLFALLAWTTPRLLRGSDPARYLSSLPILGTSPPGEGEPSRIIKVENRLSVRSSIPPWGPGYFFTRVYEVPLPQGLYVRRYCPDFRRDCSLMVSRAGLFSLTDEAPRLTHPPVAGGSTMWWSCDPERLDVAEYATYVVREDAARGLLILDGPVRYALDRSTLAAKNLYMRDVIDATSSPPRGWFAAAAMGFVVAILLEIRRFRARRRLARIATAPAGVLGEDGWLVLGDASAPLHVGLRESVPPGPVIVLSSESQVASQGPYRGDALPAEHEILAGERRDVLARERWGSLSPFDAGSLALVLLAATPLLAFWQR